MPGIARFIALIWTLFICLSTMLPLASAQAQAPSESAVIDLPPPATGAATAKADDEPVANELAAPSPLAEADLDRRYSAEAYLAQMRYKGVAVTALGQGLERAYIFTPTALRARGLPLVLFHHGWLGMSPKNFGSLIDLLVRRGAVVIFPVYQDGDRTSPQDVTRIAAEADLTALQHLRKHHAGLVDESRTFYFGFSMGAAISLNLALTPDFYGLPAPKALMLVAPGNAEHVVKGDAAVSIYGRVESLRADLPTILVTGAADTSIGVPTARMLAGRLCHLQQRSLLLLPSDTDGGAKVQAGHGSPGAPDARYDFDANSPVPAQLPPRQGFEASVSLNQLDFHGYWRLATRLMDYVAGGDLPTELFANTAANRYLGRWPSGKAYAPARIESYCRR